MQFLAPLFFVALAGLAIPVLLHLTQREKKQIVRFPSLMFVRRIPYQSVRRRKLHNLLLLALRLAALALIILAFARPLIRGDNPQQAAGTGARELVVLVDTSYSMGFADRWERARDAAHAAMDGIRAGDRASLVFFASGAEIALRSTPERERLKAAIAAAKPSAGSTRYAPALKVAGSILSESTLPRREVVLISDFQRTGWRGEEGARLPTGTVLTPVSIQGGDGGNVSVTAVSLARSTFSNQERVTVTAGLINRTDRPVPATTVALQVAGLPIATKPLMIEPGGSTSVTFDAFTVSDRNMRGTVRVGDDALAADNTFNFVVSPVTPLRLTLVDRGGPPSLFLARALAIGESPKFETTTRPAEAVSEDDLRRSAVVVLNDVAVPAALARRLARFVEQGGGLLVITGARASWPQDVDVLPGSIGNSVDRTRGTAARIGALEFGHPVLEPFRAPRSGNFSTSRVYGYRNVTKVAAAQVLAAFDSGAPAVLERRVGTGRVMMWASSVDNVWNDLPVKGVFLPFVHQTIRHLAAYREPRPWLTVGQVLDADTTIGPQGQDAQRILLSPSGKRMPMDDEGSEVTELTEQGFYELRTAEKDVAVVAANVDPAEADLSPMDPKEISVATVGSPDSGGAAGPGVPLTPEAQERNQRLWWYLLLAGVALLGAETVLSNRLAKT